MTRKQSIVIAISWPFDDIVTWWKRSNSSLGRALSIAPRTWFVRRVQAPTNDTLRSFQAFWCATAIAGKAALPLVEEPSSTRPTARWLTLNTGCGM